MKKYKKVTKTTLEIESKTCDNPKCKKTILVDDMTYGKIPIHTITITGGYGSEWPGDLKTAEVDLCEDCLEKMFGKISKVEDTVFVSRA